MNDFNSTAQNIDDAHTLQPKRTLLIDPTTRAITEHTYNGDWRTIAPALGAEDFEAFILSDGELYIDNVGLFAEGQSFFAIDENWLVGGKAMLFGPLDIDEGESAGCTITVEEAQARIRWLSAEDALAFGRELDRRHAAFLSTITPMASL